MRGLLLRAKKKNKGKVPMMLCNDCLKVYYHYDPNMHMGEKVCEFCRGENVCGCFNCIGFAYGQMDLDFGGRFPCIGGKVRKY